jgi:hypothetical protein
MTGNINGPEKVLVQDSTGSRVSQTECEWSFPAWTPARDELAFVHVINDLGVLYWSNAGKALLGSAAAPPSFGTGTMKCEDFRKCLLQDPSCSDAEFLQHRDRCASCEKEWQQAQSFERMLRAVILQPRAPTPRIRMRPPRRRLWQRTRVKVVSVLLLAGSIGSYSLVRHMFSQESLAEVVVHHVQAEPGLLQQARRQDDMSVAAVFAAMGFELQASPDAVTAASPCWIRKGRGVHMVVQGEKGAVTLLLMPGEYVDERQVLHTEDWSGMLVPERWGSLAVLASAGEDAGAYVDLMERNLRWKGRSSSRRF